MTVQDLIKKLLDCDLNKDVAVCPNDDEDGVDFIIEEGDYTVFFVAQEWGATNQV